MDTPRKEDFRLSAIEIPKNGGLVVKWKYSKSVRDEIHEVEDSIKTTVEPHPDLKSKVRSLKDYYLEITHLGFLKKVMERDQFKADESQKKLMESGVEELKRLIRISKLSFSGSEDNFGLIITGEVEAWTGQKMAFNTHRVKTEDEIYGFENELADLIEEIRLECYEFIYNGKMAEPDLFQNSVENLNQEEDGE
mgnify:CR=1 FL=1